MDIFNYPWYKCNQDCCDFECSTKKDMIEHFEKEHMVKFDLNELQEENKTTNDIAYIILKKLVDLVRTDYKKRTYITIANKEFIQT